MNRTGKIARLPRHIREELNARLEANAPGREIVAWLNGLPEVQNVLQHRFHGKPVSEQNLSEWRHGGYAEWQTRREFLENVQEKAHAAADLEESAALMADYSAGLLAIRIADTLTNWNGDPSDPAFAGLKHLSSLVRDIAILSRRAERAARLRMEQHAFSAAAASHSRGGTPRRQDDRFATSPYVRHWSRHFGPPEPLPDPNHNPDEILSGLRELMHGYYKDKETPPPPPPESPACHSAESNEIKPSQTIYEDPYNSHIAPNTESPARDALTPTPTLTHTPTPPLPAEPGPIGPLSPISPIPPVPSASSPAASDWELRNRPLPGEPEPAWRTNLRTQKTIPPWELPGYRWGELPSDSTSFHSPRHAILARAGH